MALARVEGLILRTRNLGEADRLVTLLTRERGKLQAVARGARRARSRLLAVSQLFAHGRYLLFLNERSLHTLSQGELIRPFRRWQEDLLTLAHASYIAEVADLLVPEEEEQELMFEAVLGAFGLLESGAVPPALVARWFELQALANAGFRPEIGACTACRRPPAQVEPASIGFSVPAGGVLCPECAGRDGTAYPLPASTYRLMVELLRAPLEKIGALQPAEGDIAALGKLLATYLEFRLEKKVNALAFLQSVQGAVR